MINGLTRRSHPCQVMADVMTFEEHRGPIRGKTVAWTGDANNVLASWMHAAERFEFRLRVATPPELAPKKWLHRLGQALGRRRSRVGTDPEEAVDGADCVVTDTWVSMGDKDGAAPPQPAQALPGQCPADGAGEARCACSCTACRPIAARR